ncbi:NAD+ diphosphatase [Palleronia aestuarii]|uniref:NAD(+) diphosphatase n=1 Tax=Palleronia aestuarii TaxID=568105 RepID=A0A2W7NFR2_9RHOB|nr:NAD(+) diphosphatase [Palleronia aestuarii]PZX19068.1 NAD+ diphosphatase [Palleronia aestuarii]
MKRAEEVTFGGSGLDRAAHLRGAPNALGALLRAPGCGVLPVWRGKPLVRTLEDGGVRLAWTAADHPALDGAPPAFFLGREGAGTRFAIDLSHWDPGEMPETLGAFADPSRQEHPMLNDGAAFVELRSVMTALSPRDAELAATARGLLEWHRTHPHCARCGALSEIAQAGWQRLCPACGAHHFPRTDPVVIMLVTRGNSVLIGRSPAWPPRMYSLLAGFVEPGETVEAAVRRETFEETGVRVGEVGYLASQPWPFPASLMLGCYGHAISSRLRLDTEEIEAAEWVTREDMMEVFAGRHPRIDGARQGAIAHFLLKAWLRDDLA